MCCGNGETANSPSLLNPPLHLERYRLWSSSSTKRPNETFCLERPLIIRRKKSHSPQEKRSKKEQSHDRQEGGNKVKRLRKINEKRGAARAKPWLTRATEFLALDLPDAFVGKAARAGAAGAAGLDGVGAQVVGQPLQVTVTDERVLSQVTAEHRGEGTMSYTP